MTDPKRWIESEDASFELESRVLREELRRSPPAGLEDAGWAALAANIAAQAAATGAATSASSGGSALAGGTSAGTAGGAAPGLLMALKAAAIGAGLGAVVLSGAELLRPALTSSEASGAAATASASVGALSKPRTSTVPSAARSSGSAHSAITNELPRATSAVPAVHAREPARLSSGAAPREARAIEPSASPPALHAPAAASFPDSGSTGAESSRGAPLASAQRDELKQEALELASAKNLLRAGRANEAYSALVLSAQRFPVGALSEERELLLVETLHALGQKQVARDRAQRFLNTHPHSAITVRMRKYVDGQ